MRRNSRNHKSVTINLRPAYGISEGHVRKLSYDELFLVFYGLHQLRVPNEIAAKLNPAEYLGLHLAAQIAKQEKRQFYTDSQNALSEELVHEQQPEKLAGIRAQAFRNAVNGLIAISYASTDGKPHYAGIIRAHHMVGNPHSARPGDLQCRLDLASADTKAIERFLESFRWPLMRSYAESETHGSFYDPGAGRERDPSIYTHTILGKISERCIDELLAGIPAPLGRQ